MDNLYFIPNNILIIFFKELKKYENDYQQYLNYIYIYIYIGFALCILLYIFKCIHAYACGYKLVYIIVETLWESMRFCQVAHSLKPSHLGFHLIRACNYVQFIECVNGVNTHINNLQVCITYIFIIFHMFFKKKKKFYIRKQKLHVGDYAILPCGALLE